MYFACWKCQQMEKDFKRLNSKVLDQKVRFMRDSLIFYGIRETGPGRNIEAEQEICGLLVKELIESKLDIDATNITLDRAYRLGNRVIPNRGRSLPNFITTMIRSKFTQHHSDSTMIWKEIISGNPITKVIQKAISNCFSPQKVTSLF